MKLKQLRKFKTKFAKNILYIISLFMAIIMPFTFSHAEPLPSSTSKSTSIASTKTNSETTSTTSNPAQYCPPVEALSKIEMNWVVGDSWKSYSESFVNKITSFAGAQWVGIKVGKIICLYIGDNSFDFPIALEQLKSSSVLEPSGQYWSALTNNRKFCKSTSIYDCPFLVQQEAAVPADIYESIKYQPRSYQQNTSIFNN